MSKRKRDADWKKLNVLGGVYPCFIRVVVVTTGLCSLVRLPLLRQDLKGPVLNCW